MAQIISSGRSYNKLIQNRLSVLMVLLCLFSFMYAAPVRSEGDSKEKPKRKWMEYFQWSNKKKQPGKRGAAEAGQSKITDEMSPEGMVDLIDTPTPNVVDYGGYRANFRLYSKGGVSSHLSFGVFRRLNIGASWDLEKVIGNESLSTNVPALYAKFRVYDGGQYLPAFAIGYDGQGRFFDQEADLYRERERGLYGVFGRELFLPHLEAQAGVNIAKFKEGAVFGSLALSYTIEQKVVIMAEYDNIRSAPENRFNAGIRFFPISSLAIDFAVRHLVYKADRERIIRINFVGSF